MEDPLGIAAPARILLPDLGADEEIDWVAAETRWGTRLPRDHKAFMPVWGAGSFADVCVLMPLPKEYLLWDPGTFEEETENARLTWEMLGGQEGVLPYFEGVTRVLIGNAGDAPAEDRPADGSRPG